MLGKRRESLMFQSEAYKKLVREYLESEGYSSLKDSYHEGQLTDLVLVSLTSPDVELWVECKSTKISPSDNELKKELLFENTTIPIVDYFFANFFPFIKHDSTPTRTVKKIV